MGDKKLTHLMNSVTIAKSIHPTVNVVELGSYCGYSAVAVGSMLTHKDSMTCVEVEPQCTHWSRRMIQYAGLEDRITVVNCQGSQVEIWKQTLLHPSSSPPGMTATSTDGAKLGVINLLFIDHDKASYYKDLLAIEQSGLLVSNSIVVADNVLSFGKPLTDYLSYVRDSVNGPFKSSVLHESMIEYAYATVPEVSLDGGCCTSLDDDLRDGVEISIHR